MKTTVISYFPTFIHEAHLTRSDLFSSLLAGNKFDIQQHHMKFFSCAEI